MNYVGNGYIDLASVSYRLKQLRLNYGFTLEYLSSLLSQQNIKISVSALWKYENNQILQLNINTIAGLSKIYNVPPKYILYGDMGMDINLLGEISDKKLIIINGILQINDIEALRELEKEVKKIILNSGFDNNN